MAKTEFGVNHPLAVKVWSKKLMAEAIANTWIGKFIAKSKDALIYRKDELGKNAGDQVTFGLRMKLQGDGVQGDATLEGQEEALTTFNDALLINQLRHATRSAGKMSEQRVPFDVRQDNMEGLRDWWAERLDAWFANQMAGNTVPNDTRFTGNNAITAIDADHIIRAGAVANDESLAANNFTLTLIDQCVERAKTFDQFGTPNTNCIIRPLTIEGGGEPEKRYAMFLHPYQVRDMRTNTNPGQWADIQKAAAMGGEKTKNAIFTGALGEYNGVVLHEWARLPKGISSATGLAVNNTRRAVFAGAQAACVAFGSENGVDKMTWFEELFDYGNQLGVSAGLIGGLKRTIFNAKTFGAIVVPTATTTA